ncbi:hypothetical protein [Cohnella silvisoli]|uniref:Pentapeptide repeat-containing protein n=1 Tax=Cohnella silvisoli TaxID=2873699 RepID=A0ABV1L452_9BACL|nr:hypothetical protein [Cohnella silvisoli]MCD9026324.1 hypothetical protein [Cohnella silvisoli]
MEGAFNQFGDRYRNCYFAHYIFQITACFAVDVRRINLVCYHHLANLEVAELTIPNDIEWTNSDIDFSQTRDHGKILSKDHFDFRRSRYLAWPR